MINISYTKVLIYSLTFITYAYSGYGSGILNNLRDAVMTAETVFGDVFENVITVAKKFQNVHEIFNDAVEEECVFKCPGGKNFITKIIILSLYMEIKNINVTISCTVHIKY